jgi:hypothetical protein
MIGGASLRPQQFCRPGDLGQVLTVVEECNLNKDIISLLIWQYMGIIMDIAA